jgi:hypothetical protein
MKEGNAYHSINYDRTNRMGNLSGLVVGKTVTIEKFSPVVVRDFYIPEGRTIGLTGTHSLWEQLHFCVDGWLQRVELDGVYTKIFDYTIHKNWPKYQLCGYTRTIVKEWDLSPIKQWVCSRLSKKIIEKYTRTESNMIIRLSMLNCPEETHEQLCKLVGVDPQADKALSAKAYD